MSTLTWLETGSGRLNRGAGYGARPVTRAYASQFGAFGEDAVKAPPPGSNPAASSADATAPATPPMLAGSNTSMTKAGTDLMLLLLKSNVPNLELFAAKTDRDLALLAVKYEVELPRHLAHLPSLPAPLTEAQKMERERLAMATTDTVDAEKSTVVKERPPRRAREKTSKEEGGSPEAGGEGEGGSGDGVPTHQMRHASLHGAAEEAETLVPQQKAVAASKLQQDIREKVAHAMEDSMLKGKAVKEKPERQGRKKASKKKGGDKAAGTPPAAAAAE